MAFSKGHLTALERRALRLDDGADPDDVPYVEEVDGPSGPIYVYRGREVHPARNTKVYRGFNPDQDWPDNESEGS